MARPGLFESCVVDKRNEDVGIRVGNFKFTCACVEAVHEHGGAARVAEGRTVGEADGVAAAHVIAGGGIVGTGTCEELIGSEYGGVGKFEDAGHAADGGLNISRADRHRGIGENDSGRA